MNVTNSKANNIRRKIFILFLIAFVMVASGCNTQTVEPSDETQNNPTNQTPVEPETNNTTKPNPALTINPANVAPNEILPLIYKFVTITLDAQFGINPMIVAYSGVKYLLFCRNETKVCSPTK